MRVAALNLAGVDMGQEEVYAAHITALLKAAEVELAVLPAHTAFALWVGTGHLDDGVDEFTPGLRLFMEQANDWNQRFLQIHSDLARDNRLFLVTGTTVEETNGRFYQTAYCFGPEGQLCGRQRQTHLSREERDLGLCRGEELELLELAGMRVGIVVGTDARHPEVGRIFALEGAALVAHTGALAHGLESRGQLAGIWAQVQQNQFWAVEAQLKATICHRTFAGQTAIIGPCEVTPGYTGYLAQAEGDESVAMAKLMEGDRETIKSQYPLLKLLNPKAYVGRLPDLYP